MAQVQRCEVAGVWATEGNPLLQGFEVSGEQGEKQQDHLAVEGLVGTPSWGVSAKNDDPIRCPTKLPTTWATWAES